jgi:peptidoglycan/xylan/chitin deacetylase (PgdA/CDA1 family)
MMAGVVCLTFDVDAEAGLGARAADSAHLLSTLSERRFGVVRGLPRILDLLAEFELPGTFYVPGATAERHPEAIARILAEGHEVGHHGHRHLRDADLSSAERRAEIEDGLAALAGLGAKPHGYRSPAWELTSETLALLHEYGFRYDSSCMGDDRPYLEGPPDKQLLELPVHWSLDDWVYFGLGAERPPGDVDLWRRTWTVEVDHAAREDRVVTLTMHPEIVGRAHRLAALVELIAASRERGVEFARHADVAETILSRAR